MKNNSNIKAAEPQMQDQLPLQEYHLECHLFNVFYSF